jgi:hypothetical protein
VSFFFSDHLPYQLPGLASLAADQEKWQNVSPKSVVSKTRAGAGHQRKD